jgi:CDP-6-deoxy-D-xylo-4-hexulose-3-dehydrase
MIAHTLANPFDIKAVREFCNKHNLWLIEDNCDAMGSEYTIDGVTKKTGAWGDIGTSSFYPAHHMTMGEGGAVYTDNPLLNKIIRSMRDWGRDCICPSGRDNLCGHRFDGQYGLLPKGYDHKYVYSHFGFNLKPTDMQSAIGCAQLEKLPDFIQKRKENFEYLKTLLKCVDDKIVLPEAAENSDPSWFGFLMTCKDGVSREKVVRHLEENKIQTRMLFAGNLTKHPCFDNIRDDSSAYRIVGLLENTDLIMNNSFWVGVYPGMTKEMLEIMAEKIICTIR